MPFLYATEFDFKPVNAEYLLLSRLDFLTKHKRIYQYMWRQNLTRNYEISVA
jgi:hypothetical protein